MGRSSLGRSHLLGNILAVAAAPLGRAGIGAAIQAATVVEYLPGAAGKHQQWAKSVGSSRVRAETTDLPRVAQLVSECGLQLCSRMKHLAQHLAGLCVPYRGSIALGRFVGTHAFDYLHSHRLKQVRLDIVCEARTSAKEVVGHARESRVATAGGKLSEG